MKILIFAPHRDDEIIGVGGTILKRKAAGDQVAVCLVTAREGEVLPDVTMRIHREMQACHAFCGVDEYYGLPYSNDMGVQKGKTDFVRYPPLPLLRGDEVVEEQPDQRSLTERYVEQCVSFMRGAKGRPFFLYLAHMHVHLPLYAQDRFVQASLNGDYGACVEEVDEAMEALMAQIRAQGIEQDTLVIFTSDNGSRGDHGASNAPLRGGKFTAWEGGVRVPCVMYWPGHIPAGQVNPNMAANVDILPTLSALAGGRRPGKDIDGVDISAMLTDEAAAPRENMIYFAPYGQGSQLCAVREGKWKLHLHRDGKAVRELWRKRYCC